MRHRNKRLKLTLLFLLVTISTGLPVKVTPTGKYLSAFEWTIRSSPSPKHKSAIEHCVSILQNTWVSKLPVKALFKFDGAKFGEGFLAMAQPTSYMGMDGINYPSALGKSMFSDASELDAAVASKKVKFDYPKYDLQVEFNKKEKWYTGIDGKTPPKYVDLVTLCLHEVYHGLMFIGSDYIKMSDQGSVRVFPNNGQFDSFLVTKTTDGKFCPLKSFYSDPEKLKKAVTNDNLYFATNDRRIAKLHAPFEFTPGSSIHHLDENTYQSKKNRLMTPVFKRGESTHEIGPIVKTIQKILRNKSSERPDVCDSSASPVEPKKLRSEVTSANPEKTKAKRYCCSTQDNSYAGIMRMRY